MSRRYFLQRSARGLGAAAFAGPASSAFAQQPGARPIQSADIKVLNPRARVPVGLIIDDSTCLVNLNRFAMPQFDAAWGGRNKSYQRDWKSWPAEIPDRFVRKFGEWCAENGVKGKYSIVPYPACVGRLDRELPGWSRRELNDSIKLVRELMTPNWDIHPEMVTHTRVIDLPCEGLTTPGGYGNKVLPELSRATLESVRDVFGAEIPHYFRHLYTDNRSVAPRVENAANIDGDDPECVVSIIGCTGDWTGGWDNVEPAGADMFIDAELQAGRMVDVISRGEPAMVVCHWTGMYWNGQEKGFNVIREVVRRLHARFDHLIWMKLSELARYWAARELTRITRLGREVRFHAPFACPDYTVSVPGTAGGAPGIRQAGQVHPLRKVAGPLQLRSGTWCASDDTLMACFSLPKGDSTLVLD